MERRRRWTPEVRTWSEYRAALATLNRGGARWQVVPLHELRDLEAIAMATAGPQASLSFLPWVRQGAAAAITTPDSLGAGQRAVADLSAVLSVNGSAAPPVTVRLRGPADVVGIDANQVVRRDPRPDSLDFEPNYFASIEFDRPDFPWLFTPARADASGKLRPWLCLVVVRKQDGVTLGPAVDAPCTVLQIAAPAKPAEELPDLADSWAWAHAQAAASDGSAAQVGNALAGAPALSLSRLLCPRILAADTDYIACVVPTFELGRKAGLGLPIAGHGTGRGQRAGASLDADAEGCPCSCPSTTTGNSAPARAATSSRWCVDSSRSRYPKASGAGPSTSAGPASACRTISRRPPRWASRARCSPWIRPTRRRHGPRTRRSRSRPRWPTSSMRRA